MSSRAIARKLIVHFSTRSLLQSWFREFGSTSNWPHNLRPCVWRCVGEQFADVNVVNRMPLGGGRVMVWAGINYGQRTQLHFIYGNLNAQIHRDEILRPIVRPILHFAYLYSQSCEIHRLGPNLFISID